ncbi:beta-parvin-like isoform X2 [Rhopilema esculentum]|uniref:beta-parvin-like isoform X2 n=1 Tax=Rhopilema esculentum TaxID=499914 RepID=UPI0031D7CC92
MDLRRIAQQSVRKKATEQVNELEEQGKKSIEDPTSPTVAVSPDSFLLDEGQERYMVAPNSLDDHKVRELCEVLSDWINDVLQDMRIVVRDIAEDLYDGHILALFVEKLSGRDLGALTEVTQSVNVQKQKLDQLVTIVNELLDRQDTDKWTMELIHAKHLPAILYLLVALAKNFECPFKLPNNVVLNVVVVQKRQGILRSKTVPENVTEDFSKDRESRQERDAFDTLFDHAPEKLSVVKKSLQGFVNKHLGKLNLEVSNLDKQFHDGVYFILLIGLLEEYFVPLHLFHLTPNGFEQKVHNVEFALDLLQDAGLGKPKAKPEDIVMHDLKATLRVLYALFTKYKNM